MTNHETDRRETVEYFVQCQQPDGTWEQASSTATDLDFAAERLAAKRRMLPDFVYRIAQRTTVVVVGPAPAAVSVPPPAPRADAWLDAAAYLETLDPAEAALSGQYAWHNAAAHLRRKAGEDLFAATPCSPIVACEPGGEPCDTHERLLGHIDGDHELCGPECSGPCVAGEQQNETPEAEAPVVAYRSRDSRSLYCTAHSGELFGLSYEPVTAEDLPDGGICTYPDCGRDVLAEPHP